MSAKQYDCPACGRVMVTSDDPEGRMDCRRCGQSAFRFQLDAIERRTLTRIEEAERPLVEALEATESKLTFHRDRKAVQDALAAYKSRAAERGKT